MGVEIYYVLTCNRCAARFEPSFKLVPNSFGRTKMKNGLLEVRKEARASGWSRAPKLTRKIRGDLCQHCSNYSELGVRLFGRRSHGKV